MDLPLLRCRNWSKDKVEEVVEEMQALIELQSSRARQAGPLLAKVQEATGEERPAAALISFAGRLTGRQTPQTRLAAAPRPQSNRRGLADHVLAGADQPNAWPYHRDSKASSCDSPLPLRRGSPEASYITFRGETPTWTPQPGSTVYARLAQAYKLARERVENFPSVRAYGRVGEGASSETEMEQEELKNSRPRVHTPPVFDNPSFTTRVSDAEPEVRSESSATTEISIECDIPWTETELRAVFQKFSDADEREVRTEVLYSLLRYLGARPSEDDVQNLVREQTWYASFDWFEFIEFIRRYREHDLSTLRMQFANADKDGNGSLDFEEISQLLMQSGFAPTPEATLEALQTVDVDDSGTVSFSEFEVLREHLRTTRGFMRAEAEEMKRLFLRISRGEEKCATEEIWRISTYLGYQMSQEEINNVVKEVDQDCSGYINFDELLEIVRGIRDGEKDKLLKVIGQFAIELSSAKESGRKTHIPSAEKDSKRPSSLASPGARSGGKKRTLRGQRAACKVVLPTMLALEDIGHALSVLGYFVSPEIITEILGRQLRKHGHPDYLTAEEVMIFLDAYRESGGFTQEELEHMLHIFQKEQRSTVAGNNDEALDALELGRVLRGFGISRTLQQVQRLIEDIDFDGSGEVEFNEFTKLMRQLFHEEARQRRQIFESLDHTTSGKLHVDRLEVALQKIMDVAPDAKMIESAMASSLGSHAKELGIYDFEKFFGQYRRCLIQSVQEHAGFVPSEVEILRDIFNSFDLNDSGRLEASELRNLIDKHVPEARQSVDGKKQVIKMIEEVSMNTIGILDFNEFLWLIRKCHDMRDEKDIVQEVEVVRHCEFSTDEVEGLRQLFSSHIDWAGELQLDALAKILDMLVDIRGGDYEELEYHLKDLNPDRRPVARFPQFLLFMRKLTDENLFGVNEAVDRTLVRQKMRRATAKFGFFSDKVRRGGVGPVAMEDHLPALKRRGIRNTRSGSDVDKGPLSPKSPRSPGSGFVFTAPRESGRTGSPTMRNKSGSRGTLMLPMDSRNALSAIVDKVQKNHQSDRLSIGSGTGTPMNITGTERRQSARKNRRPTAYGMDLIKG